MSALLDLSSGSQGNQLEDLQQIAEISCSSVSSSSVLQFCLFHDIMMNTWRNTCEGHLLLMKQCNNVRERGGDEEGEDGGDSNHLLREHILGKVSGVISMVMTSECQ